MNSSFILIFLSSDTVWGIKKNKEKTKTKDRNIKETLE